MMNARSIIARLAPLALVALAPAILSAHEYEAGKIKVLHPWMRVPLKGERTATLYMVIENDDEHPDRLVGGSAAFAGKVTAHDSTNMAASGITVPPFSAAVLRPGGDHVMLADLKEPVDIEPGDMLDVTLVFEKAGQLTVNATVEAPKGTHAHDFEAMDEFDKELRAQKAK